jgi:hypothetical protein
VRIVSIAVLLAGAVSAQVTGPLLGWLPEGSGIRPMRGFPAAATLGRAENLGHALTHIAVSPCQNYVLGSDAATGEVLLIAGGSVTALSASVKPDQIVISPRGSSAALWYSGASQFEILSGLPATPSIRIVDASLANANSFLAVSDDGQSVASASSAGVYEWTAGSAPHQIYGGSDAAALAFLAGTSELAIATSTQLLSVNGSATTVLYSHAFSPAGLAASFDGQEIVLADQSGTIYSLNSTTHAASTFDCQCRPSGVFGLGGAIFRLTGSSIGAIKLLDAAAGSILAVPGDAAPTRMVSARSVVRPQSTVALPTLTISLNPTPTGYLQQPAMTITASSAYASEIDGTVTLTFVTSTYTAPAGSTDQTIQFGTGGTTVNFTIPAGSTKANFSGAPSVTFSTGTTQGTITLTANVTAPTAVSAVATQTVTNLPAVAVITGVTLSTTPGVATVVLTGYSPDDDVISAIYQFALASNATLDGNYISVPVSPYFEAYYATTASYATGSEFTLTVPFAITGNSNNLTGVTVILINSVATSDPVSSK